MSARLLGRRVLVLALSCLLFAASAAADVAVLHSGARVTGDVRITGQGVLIENENGTTRLHASRVVEVIRSGGRTVALAQFRSQSETAWFTRRVEAEQARSRTTALAALQARSALEERISVGFSELPLTDAISYVQEITGANFAYSPAELEATPMPVNLELTDVTVRQVLGLLLEGRGLSWSVRDNVIRIRPTGTDDRLEIRVYDVRDLLVNIEDRSSTRTGTLGGYGGGNSGPQGSGYQSGGRDRSEEEYRSRDGDQGQDGYQGWSQSLNERTYDLARMITETVRPESWAQPAVIEAGRDGREG